MQTAIVTMAIAVVALGCSPDLLLNRLSPQTPAVTVKVPIAPVEKVSAL
jgi:hypothetical protein